MGIFDLFQKKGHLISADNPYEKPFTLDINELKAGKTAEQSIAMYKDVFALPDSELPYVLPYFYDAIFDLIEGALNDSQAHTVALQLYLPVFSTRDYVPENYDIMQQTSDILAQKAPQLADYLQRCIEKNWQQDMAESIQQLFDIFFYHNAYNRQEGYELIAPLTLPFMQKYPKHYYHFFDYYIEKTENAEQILLDILVWSTEFPAKDNPARGFWWNMLSSIGSSSDLITKQALSLTKQLIKKSQTWPLERQQNLLSIVASLYERDMSKPEDEKRHHEDLNYLNRNKKVNNALTLLAETYPDFSPSEQIHQLLMKAEQLKNRPKTYDLNQRPQILFKDLGLKLAVIDELMYHTEQLKPRVELAIFAQEYDKRFIDIDEDGYAIIPEVKKYFQNLDIPADLLNQITALNIDGGFDGGSALYQQMWPFYDPGLGDELLPITNKAIDDLELLPNLRKIRGLENCRPSKLLLKALQQRNIELIPQETE